MTPQNRLIGQSALEAFRADIPIGGTQATPEDQAAVTVATLLRQSLAADPVVAARVQDEAIDTARTSLGERFLAIGCTYDDHPAGSRTDVIRLLAQRTDHAGRVCLAQHLLESMDSIETDPVESGRILFDRCRMSRKRGFLDLSFAQGQQLVRVAQRLKSPGLLAMAQAALAGVAETRGNFVELRERMQRVVRLSRKARLVQMQALGLSGIGTSDAIAGRYGDAVASLWSAYQLSGGEGQIARTVLANLGQTLLVSGRPAEARKIATIMLGRHLPILSALPVLGTFAIASAQLDDAEAVKWASRQVRSLAKSRHHAREVAEALIECAAALNAIGQANPASVMRQRAEMIATHYGFHHLTFDESFVSVRRLSNPEHFHAAAASAAAEIVEMEVPRIPKSFDVVPV